MKVLHRNHPFYAPTIRDFKRWCRDIDMGAGYGQRETHYPNKAAYSVAVFDYDLDRWTHIKVMVGYNDWRIIELQED